MPERLADDGRARVVIESVTPQVDGGRFPVKRVVGERVRVEADVFCDGHDRVSGVVRYRKAGAKRWQEAPLQPLVNDRWWAAFTVEAMGQYEYTVCGWVDRFLTWEHDLSRRQDADDIALAAQTGAELIDAAVRRAAGADRKRLAAFAAQLRDAHSTDARTVGTDAELAALMVRHGERAFATDFERVLAITVGPLRARYSTWYELFPRSWPVDGATHGSFAGVEQQLPRIAAMGFDVLYLPPIHPIGRSFRKGPNNTLDAGPDDPGSPWAIGADEGGHTAIHPQLGTLDDFRRLHAAARARGIEIALDIAFQCSPDHPYVREHPDWFRRRPDGSVQYAENPPKKYQDIYPFDFETDDWRALWQELRDVVAFWAGQGVRVFRVDNPHTKPFGLWEWLIGDIRRAFPDVQFLAEAFTRPRVMHRLAKLGFDQSYTYFTWRNTRQELIDYFTELTSAPARDYFRPNLWPNTPDILPEFLQYGGRPAFMLRVALAATLGANYGIYGPAFELLEHEPREPGSEEYRDSEKYQLRAWDLGRPDGLGDYITRLNRIRREHAALHADWSLRFHDVDNDLLLCFSKTADLDGDGEQGDSIVVVANLDPHHAQAGWITLPLERFGIAPGTAYQAHDLLSGARYLWQDARNFVRLDPQASPVHVLRLRRRVRSERDFDYFL